MPENNQIETPDRKALPPAENGGPPLLDEPAEERLRRENEELRRQLEEQRQRAEKHQKHQPKRPTSGKLWLLALAIAVVLILALLLGWLPRYRRDKRLAEEARAAAGALPTVSVIAARPSPANTLLMLPGNIQAITEAPILARADGYLRTRYVDIGDRVKTGQLMAVIEAPDLDQQVSQARAQLAQAQAAQKQSGANLEQGKANESLAKVTATRWANMVKRGAVSRQENDQYQSQYQAQVANVGALNQAVSAATESTSAAKANLERLIELQKYEQVRAPFDGIVTYRNVDVGALIATGSTLLFRVAQVDRLRTYLYVPQVNAPAIQVGQSASLLVAEYPGRTFGGTITRTSEALDPTTRTLLTEVQVPNPDRALLPGMFVQVNLNNQRSNPPILVPGDTLVVRADGTSVAVAERTKETAPVRPSEDQNQDKKQDKKQDNKQNQKQPVYLIHMRKVAVGRDYGSAIEIVSGLNNGELAVTSPTDDVREGAKVHVQASKETVNGEAGQQQSGGKRDVNSEQLQPKVGAEPRPNQPDKSDTKRGPGY